MAIELRVRKHPLTSVNFFYSRALYGINANFLTLTSSSILIFITSKAGLPPFLLLFYTIIIFFNEILAFLTYHQERFLGLFSGSAISFRTLYFPKARWICAYFAVLYFMPPTQGGEKVK